MPLLDHQETIREVNLWPGVSSAIAAHEYRCLLLKTLSGNDTSRILPSIYTNCPPNSYQFWLHCSTSFWIVLNRSAFYLVLIASLYIVSVRVHSYWFVSHRCAFLSIRCDSHWFVLVRSTHSYCTVVHCVYTVSVLIGLYVFVAHLISSYRIAPGTQHGPVRIRNELIGMHND